MVEQVQRFYEGKYLDLINNLTKIESPTIADAHNLAIAEYLHNDKNPLPKLLEITDRMRTESNQQEWPMHPSWAIANYHICIYYFKIGKAKACEDLLHYMWEHSNLVEQTLGLFLSLLTIEYSIQYTFFSDSPKALSFLSNNFPTAQSIQNYFKGKINNQQFISLLTEKVHFAKLRYDVARAIKDNNEQSQNFLEDCVSKIAKISPETKTKKTISLYQIMPISCAALLLNDQTKYTTINGFATTQTHFAILNNNGISEILEKKCSSALLHLSKALNTRKGTEIYQPYHQIIYNIGLSYLLHKDKKKPKKAFRHFYSIIPVLSDFPYLWLRMAECCVDYYKARVAKLRKKTQLSEVIARRLSTPTKMYTILPTSDSKLFARFTPKGEGIDANLTLEFGEKCARRAMALCSNQQSTLSMQAALICEYICLELGDWQRAIELSKHPSLSAANIAPVTRFLSKIYASQASFYLQDYANACNLLKPLLIELRLNQITEYAVMLYQTAWRAHYANQEIEKSMMYQNKALEQNQNCIENILTKVAIDLQNRKQQQALSHIQSYSSKAED